MSAFSQAFRGFQWQSLLTVVTLGLSFIKIFMLAKFLSPADFGLISLMSITLGLTESTTETGINITLLQSKKPISYFLNTAWMISIGRGVLIALIMAIGGMGLSQYFNLPELMWLILVAALVPLFRGFINPSVILLYKGLNFFADSSYRLALSLVDVGLAIVLAWWLKTAVAIPLAMVGAALAEVVISFIFFKTRPKLGWVGEAAQQIFSQARSLSLSALINYLNENADNFLIGKLTNTHALGLYDTMYKFGHRSSATVAKAMHHGALPVLTRKDADQSNTFIKTTIASLVLSAGTALPFLVISPWIINATMGATWLEGVPLLKWLIFAGILQSVTIACSTLLVASKRYGIMNFHGGVAFMLMIAGIIWLTPIWGVEGSAIAIFGSRLISLPIILWGTTRVLYGQKKN